MGFIVVKEVEFRNLSAELNSNFKVTMELIANSFAIIKSSVFIIVNLGLLTIRLAVINELVYFVIKSILVESFMEFN